MACRGIHSLRAWRGIHSFERDQSRLRICSTLTSRGVACYAFLGGDQPRFGGRCLVANHGMALLRVVNDAQS